MEIPLGQVLSLVGNLDDSPGNQTARERFRSFLRANLNSAGQVRDYVEECLRTSGDQHNKAFQDLINHVGHLLGFDVSFGRYRGKFNEIGFDGHWKSPTPFDIVLEVKTTETYAIKTSTLLDYINRLVSEKRIVDPDLTLGLYVVGRPDPEVRQLEHAIIAERKINQLRIISAGTLISLAEMMHEYGISHQDILAILRPSTPLIDQVVDLMARLVAEEKELGAALPDESPGTATASATEVATPVEAEIAYWLTPVKSTADETAEECIEKLVGRESIYAFGEGTPGRKRIRPGDRICFYSNGRGVVAHATIASLPEKISHAAVRDSPRYPWVFKVREPELYLDTPVAIDASLRSRLDAFKSRDLTRPWAWFVQSTSTISEQDFRTLTNSRSEQT